MDDSSFEPISTTHCCVCDSHELEKVIDLPKLPLSGIFVGNPVPVSQGSFDQGFLVCRECGHGQLEWFLDPHQVYDRTYSHRSSASALARAGNEFFFAFLMRIAEERRFRRVVEIGCNDLHLLRKLEPFADELWGIDPIWMGHDTHVADKIRVVPKFIEEVLCWDDIGGKPDLILSSHTLEHLRNPKAELARMLAAADDDVLCFIEVPGFDALVANQRFDQVFHQHAQYFSLASLLRMIENIGAEFVAHDVNYEYWGGTILVALKKAEGSRRNGAPLPNPYIHRASVISQRYQLFRDQVATAHRLLEKCQHLPIYGYGAAQLLPILAYHLGDDLSTLEAVLDDDSEKDGLSYWNLPVTIRHSSHIPDLSMVTILLTAVDSARAILPKLFVRKPRHVILPFHVV